MHGPKAMKAISDHVATRTPVQVFFFYLFCIFGCFFWGIATFLEAVQQWYFFLSCRSVFVEEQ